MTLGSIYYNHGYVVFKDDYDDNLVNDDGLSIIYVYDIARLELRLSVSEDAGDFEDFRTKLLLVKGNE